MESHWSVISSILHFFVIEVICTHPVLDKWKERSTTRGNDFFPIIRRFGEDLDVIEDENTKH